MKKMISVGDKVIPQVPHKFAGKVCIVREINCRLNGCSIFILPEDNSIRYGLFVHPDDVDIVETNDNQTIGIDLGYQDMATRRLSRIQKRLI